MRSISGPATRRAALAVAASMVVGCTVTPSVTSAPSAETTRPSPIPLPSPRSPATPSPDRTPTLAPSRLTSEALREAVAAVDIRAHLTELQRIADEHGGNRAAGTAGYDASVEYVASRLTAAGYVVERQPVPFGGGSTVNLIADLPGRDGADVVMLGAHLDSVPAGPGINDNGSGTMTLLTLAERLATFEPSWHTVRFAFWAAEEPGRLGSTAYVDALATDDRERIAAYLNFDMLGSVNRIRFVYADAQAVPNSDGITGLFAGYFESVGLTWEPIDLSGKSDHAPFSRAGIATGGLFSGGRELKTDAQAGAFGGTAGQPADPCSDVACDTTDNVSDASLDEMADAIAHVLVTLAGN
jgi:aminopeptidase S